MEIRPKKCLFDLWKATSAPIFHMSEFWPAFNEAGIKDFLAGEGAQPVPMRALSTASAMAAQRKILEFMESLKLLPDGDIACKSAYLDFESERLAALEMVLDAADPAKARRLNDRLFGELSSMYQPQALEHLARHIQSIKPKSAAVTAARTTLLEYWEHVGQLASVEQYFAVIEGYRVQLRPLVVRRYGFVDQLLAPHIAQGELDSEAVRGILVQAIAQILGETAAGWTALVQEAAPNVFIDYERRAIIIPAGRSYAIDHVNTLVVHEIGVHVVRSVNGERSQERLAAYGLVGYGPAEEAFGVLLGNATKAHYHQINSLVPFAVIDFATRATPSTFRRVHELTTALMVCLANPDEPTLERNYQQYQRTAFSRVNRVLRLGTTAVIERSTTKYWRGLLLLSRYFDGRGLTQESFDEFFLGKFDCLAPAQLELIRHHTR